jgi:GntR family transcriptional regulator
MASADHLFRRTSEERVYISLRPSVEPLFEQLENLPLAERAREAILHAIREERFEEGRLPSEDELAKLLNVSRTTVRTALQSLEADGIVTRRRAVGTTINRHVGRNMLALQRLVGFDRLLEEKGHEVGIEVSWERAAAPDDFVTLFGIDAGTEYCVGQKLYFADGRLAIYARDAIPWTEIAHELDDGELPASLFDFAARYSRRQVADAIVEIAPTVKRGADTTKLQVADGVAFVRLHARHYGDTGDPVAYSIIDVDDRFVRFEVFRRH